VRAFGGPHVRFGSWLRENSEIEFANGNFVSTSIILKNKSAGDGCRDKTIEKTILRTFRARTFSRSQGQQETWTLSVGTSALASAPDMESAYQRLWKKSASGRPLPTMEH
jgi:hypothetical protein